MKKDSSRLKSIETFYIALLEAAENPDSLEHEQSAALVANLQKRGKWPSKPELQEWFGKSGLEVEEPSRRVRASSAAARGR